MKKSYFLYYLLAINNKHIFIMYQQPRLYNYIKYHSWSQVNDIVYLTLEKNNKNFRFYIKVPQGFQISKVNYKLKELCLHYLFYSLGVNIKKKNSAKEYPSYFLKSTIENPRKKFNNIALAYSNGIDSGACLDMLPKNITYPFFLYRKLDKSDVNLLKEIKINKNRFKDHNYNAFQGVNKINSTKLYNNQKKIEIIETDFELVRIFINNDLTVGWHCPFGHISILILLSDYYKIGYLALGSTLEARFFGNGNFFHNVLSLSKSESDLITANRILASVNLNLFYPVGGLSEIITTKIVSNSKLKDICNSCTISNEVNCNKCIKCFRKKGIISEKIKELLNSYPIKEAPRINTVYACKKHNYTSSDFINNLILKVDLSFLERYYVNYLYPLENETHLVPLQFKSFIQKKLDLLNLCAMNNEDLLNIKKVNQIFNNS